MSTPQPQSASYFQVGMGWMMQGISFLTTSPETYSEIGKESINLLEGFQWASGAVSGEVDPAKVSAVVKQAMDPIKNFYRAGIVVSAALFFASRTISILPVLPSLFLLFSGMIALITWDIHATLREMNHTYSHFNVLAKSSGRQIEFDEFVKVINEYSHRTLSNTWIISGFDPMEKSLTDWRPHLEEQIQNQGKEKKDSPWNIGAKHLPILPLIYQVAQATDSKKG